MPNASFRVVGVLDLFDHSVEHLWALVGGGEHHDEGRCFYLLPSTLLGTGPAHGDALIPARDRIHSAGFPDITEMDLFHASHAYLSDRRRTPN